MVTSAKRKLTIAMLVLYWPVIFIATHVPIKSGFGMPANSDKILHFVAYASLTFLLWFSIILDGKKFAWRKITLMVTIVVLYGAADEFLQKFVSRGCDVFDLAADISGMLFAMAIFMLLSYWVSFLVITAIAVFFVTYILAADGTVFMSMVNDIFHFFGYGFLTFVWAGNVAGWFKKVSPKLIGATLALPAIFLFIAEWVITNLRQTQMSILHLIVSLMAIFFAVTFFSIGHFIFTKNV